jgi:hypothetical protein
MTGLFGFGRSRKHGQSTPPPSPSAFGQFLLNLATQSGLLVLLEDI